MAEKTVHVSQVNAYRTCPRMYYFSEVMRLVPKVESPKLTFGKGMHKGLETYYRTGSREAALLAYKTWLDEQLAWVEAHNGDMVQAQEQAALGEMLLAEYMNFASANDKFKVAKFGGELAVEQKFRVPVWGVSDCWNEGTFDAVVQDNYGKLWLMEHKTARDFPKELELNLNLQASVYILAAQQLFGDGVAGMVYNVIRKSDPRRARSPVVGRWIVTRNVKELTATKEQFARLVTRMLTDVVFDPNPGFHCTWQCAYPQLCLCLQDGTDMQPLVDQFYTRKEEDDSAACAYCFAEAG